MNIWNTVFIVLILLLAVVGVFFASQEMAVRSAWNKHIIGLEGKNNPEDANLPESPENKGKIRDTEEKLELQITGTAPKKEIKDKKISEMSLEELKTRLRLMVAERNMAWFGCRPERNSYKEMPPVDPKEYLNDRSDLPNDVRPNPVKPVQVELYLPKKNNRDEEWRYPDAVEPLMGTVNNLKPQPVVYLFDEGFRGDGGSFLGRFKVEEDPKEVVLGTAKDWKVTLVSIDNLSESEKRRIEESTSAAPPNIDAIRRRYENEGKALDPKEEERLKDNEKWAIYLVPPTDRYHGVFDMDPDELEQLIPNAETRKLVGDSDRLLLDFDTLLTAAFQRRLLLEIDIDSTKKDSDKLTNSLRVSSEAIVALQNDQKWLEEQCIAMENQRQIVADKLKELEAVIDDIKKKTGVAQEDNEGLVMAIARYQLQAAKIIEQRTEEAVAE